MIFDVLSNLTPAWSALSFSYASLFYFHHWHALELAKDYNVIAKCTKYIENWELNHKNHFRLKRISQFYITFSSSKYPIINYGMWCVFTGCPKSALKDWSHWVKSGVGSLRGHFYQTKGEETMPVVSPHGRHKPRWPVPTQLIPQEISPCSFTDFHTSSYSKLPVMCSTCS